MPKSFNMSNTANLTHDLGCHRKKHPLCLWYRECCQINDNYYKKETRDRITISVKHLNALPIMFLFVFYCVISSCLSPSRSVSRRRSAEDRRETCFDVWSLNPFVECVTVISIICVKSDSWCQFLFIELKCLLNLVSVDNSIRS